MDFKKGKKYFKPAMRRLSEFDIIGNAQTSTISTQAGKVLLESFNETQLEAFGLNETMRESIMSENLKEMQTFTEDNTMANSSA